MTYKKIRADYPLFYVLDDFITPNYEIHKNSQSVIPENAGIQI